jgi:hypothetical protein
MHCSSMDDKPKSYECQNFSKNKQTKGELKQGGGGGGRETRTLQLQSNIAVFSHEHIFLVFSNTEFQASSRP